MTPKVYFIQDNILNKLHTLVKKNYLKGKSEAQMYSLSSFSRPAPISLEH